LISTPHLTPKDARSSMRRRTGKLIRIGWLEEYGTAKLIQMGMNSQMTGKTQTWRLVTTKTIDFLLLDFHTVTTRRSIANTPQMEQQEMLQKTGRIPANNPKLNSNHPQQ
jgi:hypothetical protein